MLLSLHVKNLALIEEEEVLFTDGLNILTGETGAGKSIIIGSINLALGARADKSIIRTGTDYALIELTFQADHARQLARLEELGLTPDEDGTILIKRRILPARSICSICGETVTLRQLREVGELLIDIYGQRENQRLLRREAQRRTVDDYGGDRAAAALAETSTAYRKWKKLSDAWEGDDLDESARLRELDLLSYEADEIEAAALREGEEEELEREQRLLGSFRKISEAAGDACRMTAEGGAADMIGRACRALSSVSGIDENLDGLEEQLSEIDSLLADFNRSMTDYVEGLSFDPARLSAIEDRLDVIRRCQDKYGATVPLILDALARRRERIGFLQAYETRRRELREQLESARAALEEACTSLTQVRRQAASEFATGMKEALLELNFLRVEFEICVDPDPAHPGPEGWDQVSMHISMNPGEPLRPLEQVASGGELSRIMLALKTVFAGRDEIYSFIFDEIDTGISGQTAWKVSGRMGRLARDHQILCITHLPQIAAMQDSHYLIEKEAGDDSTATHIRRLGAAESDCELARLLGAGQITEAALQNAREMKEKAAAEKGPAVRGKEEP
ncbi:MAG: DNA repair protein RecN [Eubacteriales bacterium]|nr:DNA repair protein RecN [Eubacteriales bacterium]